MMANHQNRFVNIDVIRIIKTYSKKSFVSVYELIDEMTLETKPHVF